jgi:hypothetical protein
MSPNIFNTDSPLTGKFQLLSYRPAHHVIQDVSRKKRDDVRCRYLIFVILKEAEEKDM